MEETRQVFSIQKFDNTFFNLLKNQNDILNSMSVESLSRITTSVKDQKEVNTTHSHSGDRFFSYSLVHTDDFYEQLRKLINSNEENIKPKYLDYLNQKNKDIRKNLLDLINDFPFDISYSNLYILAFFRFYVGFDAGLSKHVSHFIEILNYLDQAAALDSKLDFTNYSKFLKAQLSNDEKLVIWLCMKIENKDISLLYKYDIFKGMRPRVNLEELTNKHFRN